MPRVQIHYDDGTTVEANDLGDVVNHAIATGTRGLVEVREEVIREECPHCGGAGVIDPDPGRRLLTRKQLEDKVSEVTAALIESDSLGDPEAQIKAARKAAKG